MLRQMLLCLLTTALVVCALVFTNNIVQRPGLVLLAGLSAVLGYLVARAVDLGRMRRVHIAVLVAVAHRLLGIVESGKAPTGLQGDEADAGRYQRLDSSVREYADHLLRAGHQFDYM